MTIGLARAALERGEIETAVGLLLAVWREVKDARVADILDELSTRITRGALDGSTQKKLTVDFLSRVAGGDPCDQPRLAAVIGTTRSSEMVDQVEALLATWPPDPRFTQVLVRLLQRPPFYASNTHAAWRRLFKLVQQYADPRAIELLGKLDFSVLDSNFAATFFGERRDAIVVALNKKYAKGIPRLPATHDADLAHLAALAGTSTTTTLVAEVLDNPDEAGAKDVLADHLLETNDVRGRFLVLQRARSAGTITPEMEIEEARLVKAHGVRWIGDLAALVDTDTVRFEDGFPAWCEVESDRARVVEKLVGNPAWATVREIHLAGNAFPRALLADPIMRSLTGVTGIREMGAKDILGKEHVYPWRTVGMMFDDAALATFPHDVRRAFPNVRELHLHAYSRGVGEYAFLWDNAFAELETVGFFSAPAASLSTYLAAAIAGAHYATTRIDLTELHHLGYMIRVSRESARHPWSTLDLRARSAWGRKVLKYPDLVRIVREALYGHSFTTIRTHDRTTKAEREAIETLRS